MNRRQSAIAILSLRIAYGVGLVAVPGRLTRRWLGGTVEQPAAQVSLRALGAREIALHAGALRAALLDAPLRPWLLASILGDLTDVVTTIVARRGLPSGAAPATVVVGGGSAALTAVLALSIEN